jgi:DNA helicase INO80
MENLMNLVMQFRKVCNHPDLFERRLGKIPFVFAKLQHGMLQNMSLVSKPDIVVGNQSPIEFVLPKMVFDECYFISDNSTNLFSQQRKGLDASFSNVSVETHFKFFNIFNPLNFHREIYCKSAD